MLYSTKINLDKEYIVKLTLRDLVAIEKQGIDISGNIDSIDEQVTILTAALNVNQGLFFRSNGQKMSLEESKEKVYDLIDSSEIAFFEIAEVVAEAFKLGINKGKEVPEKLLKQVENLKEKNKKSKNV